MFYFRYTILQIQNSIDIPRYFDLTSTIEHSIGSYELIPFCCLLCNGTQKIIDYVFIKVPIATGSIWKVLAVLT